MRVMATAALFLCSSIASAQSRFPEPDWEVTATGDEIFEKGVEREVGDAGPIFLMVDASVTARAPDGARRNTQATLQVYINDEACGWDSYGNEFRTSVASTHVHCFVRGTGPYKIRAVATLWHCCEGGEVKWQGFKDRKSIVNIYAFRAETPAKDAEPHTVGAEE